MQKNLLLTAATFLFFCGTAAQANDLDDPFYVALSVGHVSIDDNSISLAPTEGGGINGTGTTESLALGYEFDSNFGLELAYHDYGSPTAFLQQGTAVEKCPQNFSCPSISGVTVEGVGRYELVPQLDGELRFGVLAWNIGSPGSMLVQHTSGDSFIYGVGVRRRFDYGLSLLITYERSNLTTEETRVGLSYSF